MKQYNFLTSKTVWGGISIAVGTLTQLPMFVAYQDLLQPARIILDAFGSFMVAWGVRHAIAVSAGQA